MQTNKTVSIPGAWTMAKVEQVLGNAVANAMVRGKMSPVAELALSRMAVSK